MASFSDFDDYWSMTDKNLLFEFQRKAGKQHCCTECNRVIEVGKSYRISRLKQEKSWTTYRTCELCCDLIKWLINTTDEETYAFGELYEEFIEKQLLSKEDEEMEDDECTWVSNVFEIEIERQYPLLIRLKQEVAKVNSY